jgi:hypothetical protein
MEELSQLDRILEKYPSLYASVNYGYIPKDLLVPLSKFLIDHSLPTVYRVIIPLLSSFGFGNMENVQAYYALKVFDKETLRTFIQGEKLLFTKKGTSELIHILSKQISDIRLNQEVVHVEQKGKQVIVETAYVSELFDKVLITAKMSPSMVKDSQISHFFENIKTNSFFTCAFEVNNKRLATTYFNGNLGYSEKLQFFHTSRQNHKTILISYTYGMLNHKLIDSITADLTSAGVEINHFITAKQWEIFPHVQKESLTEQFYQELLVRHANQSIYIGGSLISKPELGNLYLSICETVKKILS